MAPGSPAAMVQDMVTAPGIVTAIVPGMQSAMENMAMGPDTDMVHYSS